MMVMIHQQQQQQQLIPHTKEEETLRIHRLRESTVVGLNPEARRRIANDKAATLDSTGAENCQGRRLHGFRMFPTGAGRIVERVIPAQGCGKQSVLVEDTDDAITSDDETKAAAAHSNIIVIITETDADAAETRPRQMSR
jgi:hypothetical protein